MNAANPAADRMFISYSHQDRETCARIVKAIERTGRAEVWYDKELIPGEIFRRKIAEKIKDAHSFVLLISETAVQSKWILEELEYASKYECHIIPVWLESVMLPAELEMILLRYHGLFWYTYRDDNDFARDLLVVSQGGGTFSEEWQESREIFTSEWWQADNAEIIEALDQEKQNHYAYCYDPNHALTLACCYYYGVGTDVNPGKAVYYFKISAYFGNQDASFYLLEIKLENLDKDKQTSEICKPYIERIEQLSREGSIPAGLFLGNVYWYGKYGCGQDYEKSAGLYEACARKGSARAQFIMASYYYHGNGVPQDYDLALMYAHLAIEQKYIRAYRRLGVFYRDGLALPKDYPKAMELFEEGRKAGDYYCCYLLGQMYENGLGAEQDDDKALELYLEGEKAPVNSQKYAVHKAKEALGHFYEKHAQYELAARKYLESYQLGNKDCKADYLRVTERKQN